eukprot:TRINITY_DN9356_c3_g1_i1.p1 TRINITY_DN9356_c3_g1~~TRINITY_DN9356_c3_g1_i1.p1  ORF type:complete len:283 (+),score=33.36 TRINITY_DN9356_c3_g1_i1:124-972(+)
MAGRGHTCARANENHAQASYQSSGYITPSAAPPVRGAEDNDATARAAVKSARTSDLLEHNARHGIPACMSPPPSQMTPPDDPQPMGLCAACGRADQPSNVLRTCPCHMVLYCSVECQHAHWQTHKVTCTARHLSHREAAQKQQPQPPQQQPERAPSPPSGVQSFAPQQQPVQANGWAPPQHGPVPTVHLNGALVSSAAAQNGVPDTDAAALALPGAACSGAPPPGVPCVPGSYQMRCITPGELISRLSHHLHDLNRDCGIREDAHGNVIVPVESLRRSANRV